MTLNSLFSLHFVSTQLLFHYYKYQCPNITYILQINISDSFYAGIDCSSRSKTYSSLLDNLSVIIQYLKLR